MPKSTNWWDQAVQNRLVAAVLAMVVIVPLIATPASASIHGAAALMYEGLGIVLLATLLWRAQWNVTKAEISTFLKTGANLPILLFMGLAGVSCIFAPYKQYAEQELLRLGAGVLLYFVVAYQFRRSEYLTKLVDTLLFVAICGALLGFAQYGSSQNEHALGLFGDHQLFGSFLMILLPLIGVIAVTEKNYNRQLVAQVATVLVGTALLLSQARSAWLGGGAGLATLGALSLWVTRRKNTVASRPEAALPIMLVVVAVGFFLLVWPQSSHILSRATSLEHADSISTWQIRQHTWQGAIQMVRARPLTGWGAGQYAVQQKRFTGDGMPLASIGGASSLGEQAHNWYLQTAAEMGIPGLLLMVGALVAFVVSGLRRAKQMDAGIRRSLLLGSMAGIVAFAVDAAGSPSWQCGQISMFLWLNLGLGTACMRPQTRGKREETPQALTQGIFSTRYARPAAVAASLAAALLLPSVVFAVGNIYAAPVSARLFPANTTIRAGTSQNYQMFVTFSDGIERDVTFDNGSGPGSTSTVFSRRIPSGENAGQTGFMNGPNNHVFSSRPRESDRVIIVGVYNQNADPNQSGQVSGNVTAQTPINVRVIVP